MDTDVARTELTRGELTGQTAVVTGGAGGIGAATARALAHRGADIVILDREGSPAEDVATALRGEGTTVSVVYGDLEQTAEIADVVARVMEQTRTVEILINAAGVALWPEQLFKITPENWERTLRINLTAPFELTRLFSQRMIDQGHGGRIVNIASVAAVMAHGPIAYGVSKAGLLALTRLTAGQLARHGINVNAVAPGITLTNMVRDRQADEKTQADVLSGPNANLTRRPNEAIDVAETIAFLCVPASRQMTGQTLYVDGGTVFH